MTMEITAGSPPLLRRMNAAVVLKAIREDGPVSRTELAHRTGLSKPTVNDVVESLIRSRYVYEEAPNRDNRPKRPGKPPRLLRFREDLGYVLGIDIGANKVLALVANLAGKVVATERRQIREHRPTPDRVLDDALSVASDALAQSGLSEDGLKGVGVGTPGLVSPSGQVSLAPQLEGWEGIHLGTTVSRWFPCPVVVDNEVRLSLLSERWCGAAQDVDHAVYIQLGVGIGAAILIDGKIWRGAHRAAGEIGSLRLPTTEQEAEPEFGLGPFEWAAGAHAFARLGRHAASTTDGALFRALAGGDAAAIDAEIVFKAAQQGDETAQRVIEKVVERIASGIAEMIYIIDPEVVIIGGGISRAGAALLDPLVERLDRLVSITHRIVLSSLGDESVALGAARLALQGVDERLFSFA